MNDTSNTPDLGQLKTQSKELLKAAKAGEQAALARILPYFSGSEPLKLAQAQAVIARENGFPSWAKLKQASEQQAAPDRVSMLFRAIEKLDIDDVQRLLRLDSGLAGSWRRTTEYKGWESALHVAAKKGSLEIARALVEAGAEVYAVRQHDYPPVFEAHYSRNQELVSYLLEASQKEDEGQPPTYGCGIDIVCASRIGMLDRVQMHVERDPFAVYRRGCIGETVLHWPAHNGHVEIVELLIKSGAVVDADEIGLYGGKPLHWAAEHAPRTLELLLRHGADPMSRNLISGGCQGFTPLHMCASQRNECVENARLLLAAGADPAAVDAQGRTPLEVAKEGGWQTMARFLERA